MHKDLVFFLEVSFFVELLNNHMNVSVIGCFFLLTDLMLPGVVVEEEVTPKTFAHINKGAVCSISLVGNR